MLVELRVQNCLIFNESISFSMKADMRNKKYATNVHTVAQCNVIKTAGVFGQNNAGKTSLIKCLRYIKDIFLNKKPPIMSNFLTKSPICEIGVTFLEAGKMYAYDLQYDTVTHEYTYEYFREITKDMHSNEKETTWLKKNIANNEYRCIDAEAAKAIPVVSNDNLICYLINDEKFPHIAKLKQLIRKFAEKILILDMNNIPIGHTIQILKKKDTLQKKIVHFIKNADLYLDDLYYVDAKHIHMEGLHEDELPAEKILAIREQVMNRIRLVSVYKGHPWPSLLFDSTGTKKLTALASYIIEALENGNILAIDELDSSLHFRLTRSIVALFNNELNDSAQLIFTAHDINLIDCKHLFRKDQIWFVHKDMKQVYVYPLTSYTSRNGVRSDSNIVEMYKKGIMGAVPEPDLINSLLEIKRTPAKKRGAK